MLTTKRIGLILLLLYAQLNIEQAVAQTKPSTPAKVEVNPVICPAQLGKAIETITNRPQFSQARWGIVVNKLNNSQIYSRDSDKYFIPASNLKLLTTAAALQQLGANYRIRTSIYGTDQGLLRLVGRGDPSLTDVQLTALARQLKLTGVRQLTYLATDKGDRTDDIINPDWEWGDIQADYGAPIGSLIINQNAVTLQLLPQQIGQPLRLVWTDPIAATQWQSVDNQSVTVKPGEPTEVELNRDLSGILHLSGQLSINPPESVSLAVINPAENFVQHLRRVLLIEGIKDNSDRVRLNIVEVQKQLANAPEIAAINSPPLSQLLVEANLNSNNLYAEALLRTLGSKVNSFDSNSQTGLIAVKQALTNLGVDPKGYVMADGSGLSRHNLVSPKVIAQTLSAMASSPYAAVYRASLPVAGVSGTLLNRLQNTPAQGVVSAKTGTMSGVIALSGYINAPNYEPLVFSIIVNQSNQSSATIRQAVDEVVLLLVSLRRC